MIDDTLHYSLMITNSMIVKEILKRALMLGLSPGQPKTLDYLNDHDGCSRMDISRGCAIDKSTATGILSRMEEKGLIKSVRDISDKRKTLIYMTPKGKEAYAELKTIFEQTDEASLKGISNEELAAFMQTLKKIRNNAVFE